MKARGRRTDGHQWPSRSSGPDVPIQSSHPACNDALAMIALAFRQSLWCKSSASSSDGRAHVVSVARRAEVFALHPTTAPRPSLQPLLSRLACRASEEGDVATRCKAIKKQRSPVSAIVTWVYSHGMDMVCIHLPFRSFTPSHGRSPTEAITTGCHAPVLQSSRPALQHVLKG